MKKCIRLSRERYQVRAGEKVVFFRTLVAAKGYASLLRSWGARAYVRRTAA